MPQLLRQVRLTYSQTALCVLLRDEYRRFEDGTTPNERCVVEERVLFDQWHAFFPDSTGEKKLRDTLRTALKRIGEMGFVRSLPGEPKSWEVEPILKIRLTVEALQTLFDQLSSHPGGKPVVSNSK